MLGGTFDPIHRGHVRLARVAQARLGLVRVLFVPSSTPPHRAPPAASTADRIAMVQLAIAAHPAFALDLREIDRGGVSFTVETLSDLRAEHGPRRSLSLLLGADAFALLPTWRRHRELLGLAHLVVFGRGGRRSDLRGGTSGVAESTTNARLHELVAAHVAHASRIAATPAGGIVFVDSPIPVVSASEVRARLRASVDARALLTPEVSAYIGAHGLYRPPPGTEPGN